MDVKKIYMMGNAHLDPAWLWRWQEGYGEVKSTFQSAIDRLKTFDDFVFTCSSASYYKWIEEDEPELFEEIKKYVKEGRWAIVGGWWVQPDCNMPSGESFVRHGLYSQRYYLSRFGKMCKTGYNVDSFGHNGNLPQILKKSGMDNYLYSRPCEGEKHMPRSLFYWESLDGTKVLTYRLPTAYPTMTLKNLKENLKKVEDLTIKEDSELILSYGVGNHGGGPTIEMIEYLKGYQKEHENRELVFSGPDQYFEDQRESGTAIPVVKGDFQHHASGCYSAHWEMKKLNRLAENALINSERYAVMAKELTGGKYDPDGFKDIWESLLFNQFHDIICGCSIKVVHEDAKRLYGEILSKADRLTNGALQKMTYRIDTLSGADRVTAKDVLGSPVVAFNPLPWEVKVPVRIRSLCYIGRVSADKKEPLDYGAYDVDGNMIKVEYTKSDHLLWDVTDGIFMASVPAYGYALYYIRPIETHLAETDLAAIRHKDKVIQGSITTEREFFTLENSKLLVEIDGRSGCIRRMHIKGKDWEALNSKGASAVVMDDWDYDTWAHNHTTFQDKIGDFGEADVKLIENNEHRAVIRSKSYYGKSTLMQDYKLYKNSDEIEVDVKLDWQEKHKQLKLVFSANVESPTALYEIPYGYIEKPCNGEEEPGLTWASIQGRNLDNTYGLTLMNDAKYSYCMLDDELQVLVARSPIYADHGGIRNKELEYDYLDQGLQTFTYAIKANHGTLNKSQIIKRSMEINTVFETVAESYHGGTLKQRAGYIHVDRPNIILTVLKRSEEDDGYILRGYETDGVETDVGVALLLWDKKITLKFAPFEIKTIKICDSGKIEETDLLEM